MIFNWIGENMFKTGLTIAFLLIAQSAAADNAEIKNVRASQSGGLWTFDVTISHEDAGWDHFADAWRILDMSGNQLAIRELIHPHVDEQPLTRSLSGIALPEGTTQVGVQVRDTVAGWAPGVTTVDLK
jgi:hypothetical protein